MNMVVTGLVEYVDKINALPMNLDGGMAAIMRVTMEKTKAVMDAFTPVDTGLLLSNNKAKLVSMSRYEVGFDLYNNTKYAGFVAYGTRFMAAQDFITPAIVFGQAYLVSEMTRLRFGL